MPTHLQSLTRLYNAITNNAINKTWITTLEPDGGAPWKEFTDALEEVVEQIENNTAQMTHDNEADDLKIARDLQNYADWTQLSYNTRALMERAVKALSRPTDALRNNADRVHDKFYGFLSDDVRSALADLIETAEEAERNSQRLTGQKIRKAVAALRSAPVPAPAPNPNHDHLRPCF